MNATQLAMRAINFTRMGRLDIPNSIGIEVSSGCNRRCWYCPSSDLGIKFRVIDDKVWQQFLDRMKEYGWRGIVVIGSGYGETGLVRDSWRYIRAIKEAGGLPYVMSNGDFPHVIGSWLSEGAFRVTVTRHRPYTQDWLDEIERLQYVYGKHRIKIKTLDAVRLTHIPWTVEIRGPEQIDHAPITRCYDLDGISVGIDGRYLTCCHDIYRRMTLGTIRSDSFADYWKLTKPLRKDLSQGKPIWTLCHKCFRKGCA